MSVLVPSTLFVLSYKVVQFFVHFSIFLIFFSQKTKKIISDHRNRKTFSAPVVGNSLVIDSDIFLR